MKTNHKKERAKRFIQLKQLEEIIPQNPIEKARIMQKKQNLVKQIVKHEVMAGGRMT